MIGDFEERLRELKEDLNNAKTQVDRMCFQAYIMGFQEAAQMAARCMREKDENK